MTISPSIDPFPFVLIFFLLFFLLFIFFLLSPVIVLYILFSYLPQFLNSILLDSFMKHQRYQSFHLHSPTFFLSSFIISSSFFLIPNSYYFSHKLSQFFLLKFLIVCPPPNRSYLARMPQILP